MLVDLGYAPKAAARLRTGNLDDEFLCSRILMLLTYETDLDFVNLVKQNDVDTTIVEVSSPWKPGKLSDIKKRLEQHGSSTGDTSSSAPTTTTSAMALAEMLSLTYNLIHLYTPLAEQFVPALTPSLNILRTYSFKTQQPIDPPVRQLINVLLILAPACSKDDTSKALVSRSGVELLLKLLDAGLKHYALPELDTNIAPLVSLLAQIYTASASDIRDLLESRLLPTAQERDKPLGKSDTLFSRLIKLTTSPSTPHLKELIPQLMWELSHADPNTLVRNVGYGYASGFLVNKGFTSSDVDPQAGTFARGRNSNGHVNFVTGQYRENEPQDSGPSMTDEEKEQEAERLFVLFER